MGRISLNTGHSQMQVIFTVSDIPVQRQVQFALYTTFINPSSIPFDSIPCMIVHVAQYHTCTIQVHVVQISASNQEI